MRSLFQDLRYAWRTLSKSPGFAVVAVLTLGLGIGANSTIFSWINSTLLNPIPGASNAGRMVAVTRGGSVDAEHILSYPDYVDLRDHNQSFSGVIATDMTLFYLNGAGKPERVWGTVVSGNYFDVLGVRPVLGRGFTPAEEKKPGGAPVVVISYGFWQSHFGGSQSVIGSTIRLNQNPYSVVGVAPQAFQGNQTGLRSDVWVPLAMIRQLWRSEGGSEGGDDPLLNRAESWLLLYGQLRPGISERQAQEEMTRLMQQIARQYPDSHRGRIDMEISPLWRARFGANYYLYVVLPMLLAIAGAVLLLACANVANLLLVRSVSRRREIAIRLAMGAGRWRLGRQFLVESLMLALAGGILAMLLTTWSAAAFSRFLPPSNLPIFLNVQVDRAVLLATLAISVLTGVAFGILPALRSSKMTAVTVLKEESGSASGGLHKVRLSSGLVVLQLSLSLLLLVCAGLFLRSFNKTQRFDPGFNPDHVLLATFDLFGEGYKPAAGVEFNRQLLAKLEALPGVQSVTLANWVPLGFNFRSTSIQPEDYVAQPHESMETISAIVGPNYMHTMEIPLLAGREFTPQDTDKATRVAVINEALAERYWPRQNPIGKRLRADGQWFSVIGVAQNSSYNDLRSLNEPAQPFVYLPLFQDYDNYETIIHARVSGDPMAMSAAVEKTVHELNADLPVFDVTTLHDRVQVVSTNTRIAGVSVGAFGLLALVLAAVGIYAVIAYTTRQRTREIGIRMAVGAQAGDIRRLVLGQGLRLTITGLALGLAVSLVLTRFLRSLLFGISSTDAFTFTSVALLLCLVALAACYIPARRAMKVDPVIALRHE
jgi:predicted permease